MTSDDPPAGPSPLPPPFEAQLPEPIRVVMGEDGLLHIGRAGNLRVDPGDFVFAQRVVRDLGRIMAKPQGAELLRRAEQAGHPVLIAKPFAMTAPPNAWIVPDDLHAATAAGKPTGEHDAAGNPLLGSGAGCGSTIVYDPADWAAAEGGWLPSAQTVLQRMLEEATMNATGSSAGASESPATPSGEGTAGLRLQCRPGKSGNRLIFQYALHNEGAAEIYVMDAIPARDPASGALHADDQATVVILGPEGDAIVGKFAPPPPLDRRMALAVMPLARLLPPGGTLEGALTIPLPLAETSPYFPDLPLRRYEIVDIRGIVFTIGYWTAGVDHLAAAPAAERPELFAVTTRNTARSARRIAQRFPTTGLQLFKRTDRFARTLD
jgi:hypothetical protein